MISNLIVPVLNRYDLLQRMFNSIDYPIGTLLVIDNNPHSHMQSEKPHWVEDIRWLHLPSNLGVAGSWNLGIKLFPHDSVWTFASNDIVYRPGALETLSTASSGSLTLCRDFPQWQTFAIGEAVIDRVGLFDERLYPAYFEDNDFLRRVQDADLPVTHLPIDVDHDNSSTLNSDSRFQERNQDTFKRNALLFKQKELTQDMGWSWSLGTRRAGEWLR